LDRYQREGERGEEKARNFLSIFDAKTLVSTGSFVEWNEDKELGVSGSALVVFSFPPWQSSFPSQCSLFIFIPIWVPRDLSVRDASNTKKKEFKRI
jgi:hypothetical protein